MSSITFVVPGHTQSAGSTRSGGALADTWQGFEAQTVQVALARDNAPLNQLNANVDDDIVVLQLAQGPELVLHPEHARDLLRSQQGELDGRARGEQSPPPLDGEIHVPTSLRWTDISPGSETRSSLGFVPLLTIKIVKAVRNLIVGDARPAVDVIKELVEGKLRERVVALRLEQFTLEELPEPVGQGEGGRFLVLIHGTFVDTHSTFGKLWLKHPEGLRRLFQSYTRVLALEHQTLGRSPIQNALTLAQQVPHGAELHLLTHSRGGLVAEVLSRVSAQPNLAEAAGSGFTEPDQEALVKLSELIKNKRLRVTRVVRAACPARGTLLASERLDAYLSVLKWLLEIAGAPVLPQLVKALGAIAASKSDPKELPGLAAMHPESPLIAWLHQDDVEAADELRVIAGDAEGSALFGWVKVLLADAFFWTDNDLVVQTRSMYGGVRRQSGNAQFLLASGGDVSHFSYFETTRTVQGMLRGLLENTPADYLPIGPESFAGKSSTGSRAARSVTGPRKPVLFLLPGILGSHLCDAEGERIWLSHRLIGGMHRLRYTSQRDRIQEDGPIELVYGELIEYLSTTYDVVPFGYDWRRPLEEEARRLAEAINAELNVPNRPVVKLLAHSMGGLLARTLWLERPQVWQDLFSDAQARLVMLGTPNAGSWAPMQVLSGDDTFGNVLAFAGAPFKEHNARQLMAEMPGFLQLQANVPTEKLFDAATWAALAAQDQELLSARSIWHRLKLQLDVHKWGLPGAEVLRQAQALRERLDKQVLTDLPRYADRLSLVLGAAPFTPDGFLAVPEMGIIYEDAVDGGDGRVTDASARLPNVRTFRMPANHTDLVKRNEYFEAVVDLLNSGNTEKLSADSALRDSSGSRSVPHSRSRPAHAGRRRVAPDLRFPAAASNGMLVAEGTERTPLRVAVWNANLRFVAPALMVGHYRSDALTGTEAVLDRLTGGNMANALASSDYPDNAGEVGVFVNLKTDADPVTLPRPSSVIVIGLGDEGSLKPNILSAGVRRGVIAWARRLIETPGGAPTTFTIAATLLGSGGVGISAATAARAIALGVSDANLVLRSVNWPLATELRLVELYLSRASEAWESLRLLEDSESARFVVQPEIVRGTGALLQTPESSYRGVRYDLISATRRKAVDGSDEDIVEFTIDSQRARAEIYRVSVQARLVERFIRETSQGARNVSSSAATLFKLLVPPEADPFLRQSSQLVLEVDELTAAIPWEILDAPQEERGGEERPWAVTSQMVRKLRTTRFRAKPRDATPYDDVLVVGEPLCDEKRFPRLPGALREAQEVAAVFRKQGSFQVRLSQRGGPVDILNMLNERSYRIVHIAGHGEKTGGERRVTGGVCLDDDTFLGPREIEALRQVPELVFVNCCHLAANKLREELGEPATFAANVARALIEIGVRCVVAAGWAVEDEPAAAFARAFYATLLTQQTFSEAVSRGREAARAASPNGSTWAAYQCYGDPNWSLRDPADDGDVGARARKRVRAREAIPSERSFDISNAERLIARLQDLAVRLRFEHEREPLLRELTTLDALYRDKYARIGRVGEAFGFAYSHGGRTTEALAWLRRAIDAPDGTAGLFASEQLANLQERSAIARLRASEKRPEDLATARREIGSAIQILERCIAIAPTLERHSLLGAAHKRLGQVDDLDGQGDASARAAHYAASIEHYSRAARFADVQQVDNFFYPALNLIAMQVFLGEPVDQALLERARVNVQENLTNNPNFYAAAAEHELAAFEAAAKGELSEHLPQILMGFRKLHDRAAAPHWWRSVYEQARFVFGPPGHHCGNPASHKLVGVLAEFAGSP